MIGKRRRSRVFACAKPTDMRKSFNTLSEVVRAELNGDPLSGDLYLFLNRRRTIAKVLSFDGTGMCIFQKRLAKGRFAAPWDRATESTVILTESELSLFLEGSQLVFMAQLSPPELHETGLVSRSLTV